MKKIICLLVLVIGIVAHALAQGTSMSNPINAGNYSVSGSFSDAKNNSAGNGFTNNFGQPSNDVWYSFTVGVPTNTVTISLCGSNFDTFLHVLNSSGSEIASNDDNGPLCGGTPSSLSLSNLPAGTYYIDAEGYGSYTGAISFALNITIITPLTVSYPGPQSYTAGVAITPLNPVISGGAISPVGQTSTFAGMTDSFNQPLGATVDASGNVYIAEGGSHLIRKITSGGSVSVFAGSGQGFTNGTGTGASFYHPVGLATDAAGNIYVADEDNNAIRKITPGGVVSTYAGNGAQGSTDGAVGSATFYFPCGVAVDNSGNVYVADAFNNKIRKITTAGVVSTLAGSGAAGTTDGTGGGATFNQPFSLVTDASGNIYVTDRIGAKIRKVTPAGVVTTLAGSGTAGYADGTGTGASFNAPTGLGIDNSGNLYVADEGNNRIRKVTSGGVVTTLSGTGAQGSANGSGTVATFYLPFAIAAEQGGLVYVGDFTTNLIRKIVATPYTVSPILPSGLSLNSATGVISGTPLIAAAQATYLIKANNNDNTAVASLPIQVNNPPALGISQDQNYIITYEPAIASITTDAQVMNSAADKSKEIIGVQYFDGLGRPMQNIKIKGSPAGKDIVLPVVYDQYGRETLKYLPYAATTSDGSYKSDGLTTGPMNFYYPGGTAPSGSQQANGVVYNPKPYSITNFESSPLNKVIEHGAPGPDWQPVPGNTTGHTVKLDYTTNNLTAFSGTDTATSRRVVLYNAIINGDQSRTLTIGNAAGNYFQVDQLSVTITKDENWKSGRGGTTEEYKDKDGHVVLKRTYLFSGGLLQQLSTYYVYDDRDNLCFILPPASGADAGITSSANLNALNYLCYQYQYDSRNRPVQKKLPGNDWEYTVYNQLDKIVATQDGNQRLNNQWVFNKYDALGRVLWTGIWNNAGVAITRAALQSTVTNFSGPLWENRPTGGYPTNAAWPTSGYLGSLTLNYYDDYTFGDFSSLPFDYRATASKNTRGMLTCSKTWVPGSSAVLYKMFYYDDFGRPLRTYVQHYLGGTTAVANVNNYDVTDFGYDFNNNLTSSIRRHFTTASTLTPAVTVANTYIYDHVNRKTQVLESIYNGSSAPPDPLIISKLDYNEIGQLRSKGLHKESSMSSFLQTVNYRYNERGWLQSSQTDGNLFNETLYYNQPSDNTYSKLYNGNVSEMVYTKTGTANVVFKYGYDQLNRLTSGTSTGGSTFGEQMTYDPMGNISALTRSGPNPATLTYSYNNSNASNQLQTVKNNGGAFRSYSYDGNGNPMGDGGSKTITYNLFNLPQTVSQGSTTLATYIYDGTGQKISNTGSDGRWDYISGIVYNGTNTGNEVIKFIQTAEGRATPNGAGWSYTYNLSDHLGNVRLSFDKNPTGGAARRIQEDEYYAFGLRSTPVVYDFSNNNRYLYNGKEIQTDLTSQYDYGARFYDPVIARMTSIDPHAEKYAGLSPYNYVGNNPLIFIDPSGMDLIKISVPDGKGGTKYAVVDKTIAKQAYDFAWKMYAKYGLVITESYRTDEQQKNVSGSGGLKAKVGKSRHQQGFALDFGVKAAYYNDKRNSRPLDQGKYSIIVEKPVTLTEYKTEVGEYGENVSNYDWRYGLKDYPHFELDARDYGYDSFEDAYRANQRDYEAKGGINGLPIYDPKTGGYINTTNSENEHVVIINGQRAYTRDATKEEVDAVLKYLKTLKDDNLNQ